MTDREKKIGKAHPTLVPTWYAKEQCGIPLTAKEQAEKQNAAKSAEGVTK